MAPSIPSDVGLRITSTPDADNVPVESGPGRGVGRVFEPTLLRAYRVAGGGPVPTGGRKPGRDVSTGCDAARRPEEFDFPGRVAQRVEQLELRDVVLGDRGEVLVKGRTSTA